MEYKIMHFEMGENTLCDIEKKVRAEIKKGWIPCGLAYENASTIGGYSTGGNDFIYIQMTRKNGE